MEVNKYNVRCRPSGQKYTPNENNIVFVFYNIMWQIEKFS